MDSGNTLGQKRSELYQIINREIGDNAEKVLAMVCRHDFVDVVEAILRLIEYWKGRREARWGGRYGHKLIVEESFLFRAIRPAAMLFRASIKGEVKPPFLEDMFACLLEVARNRLVWEELSISQLTLASHWADIMDEEAAAGEKAKRGPDDILPWTINLVLWWCQTGGRVSWFPTCDDVVVTH